MPGTIMTRRSCPQCGAALEFAGQKYCTSCGSPLPDPVTAAAPGVPGNGPAGSGLPVWVIAIAGILLLGTAIVLLFPHFAPLTMTPAAGTAGAGDNLPPGQSPSGTLLLRETSVIPNGTAFTPAIPQTTTPAVLPLPTTAAQVPTLTRTPTRGTLTVVLTAVPVAEPTSVITLAITQVPPQPPPASYTSSTPGAIFIDPVALEGRVHELINVQRQQNGLSSLSHDPFLADIARGHSWDMATRNFFEHENPEGKNARARGDAAGYPCIREMGTFTYEGISENLFNGYRYSAYSTTDGVITSYNWSPVDEIAGRAVNGWMNSPGHRANILTEHFIFEGIGVAFSSDDRIYITENFC